MIQVYDRHGRPIDTATWEQKLADEEYRFVAQHWVRGWKVSTVWLGLDHNFGGGGPPLIFETMIFAPADVTVGRDNAVRRALPVPADLDQYQERYPTEAAAQAGHDRALAAVVAQLGDDASADIAGPLVDGSSDSTWDGTWDAEA